ncbi:endonuclease-reverse transcriptase [Plakobranchus ocellatus]|uniref:Endonuclease-reverse transcriptase n=1 Tax=Plakobranchus ocellatus TaxID=259542 RepID=A0AAV4BUM5_9GAST|nr:endonuclease-reverse transcriptase [Plakobranchus ocellatus]
MGLVSLAIRDIDEIFGTTGLIKTEPVHIHHKQTMQCAGDQFSTITTEGKSPDNISVELIEALEDFGIGKVTHPLNEIYDTGQIPTDLSKSIFIALPKKPGATECELHRTISLMSHITKILLKIIMLRIRNKIKSEIAEEQCGFVEDKGISNAMYILRTLIERALEVQKDVYLCFIEYTKAFDKVRHDEIITELKQLNINGKDLRIIKKTMYWEQTAAMRIENKTSIFLDIKRGVRQGCVLSPDLFSLYSEIIMRNLENHPGIKVGGQNINNLRYADDTVLIAENKEDLQKLLRRKQKERVRTEQ